MGANTTSPCPPRTDFNCCLPEKVVQAPTSFLFLLPLSKLMVFLYPREETPRRQEVALRSWKQGCRSSSVLQDGP